MVFRITETDKPAFRLRKGEEGISVFDPKSVQPPLTEDEVLNCFRPGSILVTQPLMEIEAKGLQVFPILGAETLPQRLREAHAEIRPGPKMSRTEFKKALMELE
jgi:hypothetical protein